MSETFVPAGSTNIQQAEYDSDTDTLTITFMGNGESYDYFNVPASVFRGMTQAVSAGSYFHRFIKNRYSYDGPK